MLSSAMWCGVLRVERRVPPMRARHLQSRQRDGTVYSVRTWKVPELDWRLKLRGLSSWAPVDLASGEHGSRGLRVPCRVLGA
eukprot:496434-Rhodomonas_salina.1